MLPQSHFIACNYKIQTFFKPHGMTLTQESATFPSSRAKNKLCGIAGRTNFLQTIPFLCCL